MDPLIWREGVEREWRNHFFKKRTLFLLASVAGGCGGGARCARADSSSVHASSGVLRGKYWALWGGGVGYGLLWNMARYHNGLDVAHDQTVVIISATHTRIICGNVSASEAYKWWQLHPIYAYPYFYTSCFEFHLGWLLIALKFQPYNQCQSTCRCVHSSRSECNQEYDMVLSWESVHSHI